MTRPNTPAGGMDFSQQLQKAISAFESGNLDQARRQCEPLHKQFPNHAGPLHLLGAIELESGNDTAAIRLLEQADALSPGHPGILRQLAQAYGKTGLWQKAITSCRQLLNLQPDDIWSLIQLGFCLQNSGDISGAVKIFRRALDLPGEHAFTVNHALAVAYNRLGSGKEAIAAYERALVLQPENADLMSDLATLYEQANRLEEAHKTAQRGLELAPGHDTLNLVAAKYARRTGHPEKALKILSSIPKVKEARIERAIEFELARNYDKQNDTACAFAHYVKGNELTFAAWPEVRAAAQDYQAQLDKLAQHIGKKQPTQQPVDVHSDPADTPRDSLDEPVFLIGFPRSGTTLLDTLLGAHPAIEVLEELPVIDELARMANELPGGYPGALPSMDRDQVSALRKHYRETVLKHRGNDRQIPSLLIDKLPLNTIHAALIHRIFPHSRFIFSLRHPCDVCLSCFMQEFGPNAVYANFSSLAGSVSTYTKVMHLWQFYTELMPLTTHTVRYENLVADKTSTLSELLNYLQLDWHENLENHTMHAAGRGRIYTPSYHQVIRPIYRDAVDRWRKYRKEISPFMEQLKPFLDNFGYAFEG